MNRCDEPFDDTPKNCVFEYDLYLHLVAKSVPRAFHSEKKLVSVKVMCDNASAKNTSLIKIC